MEIPDDEWDRFLQLLRAEAREQEREVVAEIDMRLGTTLLYATARLRDVRKAADYIARRAVRMRKIAYEPKMEEVSGPEASLKHTVPLAGRIITGPPVPEGGTWTPFSQTLSREQAQQSFDRGRDLARQILRAIPPGSKFSMADMQVALALLLALLACSVSAGREEKETITLVADLSQVLLKEVSLPEDTQGGMGMKGVT